MASLLDNHQAKLVDYLRQHLSSAEIFRLVTAYFSIYGFVQLAEQLEKDELQTRFLFGDPKSAGNIGTEPKSGRAFSVTESGLSIVGNSLDSSILLQRKIAERCAEWVKKESVQIRSLKTSNFLHGKMYHLQGKDKKSVTVGSSNFTQRGLGASTNPNLEINIASHDPETCAETEEWFEKLWQNDKRVEDVKAEVLAELERLYAENPPELIYYKTLYEIFKEELEARDIGEGELQDAHLYDTQIWKMLYEFQKDGAKSAISRLLRYNGCILADSVGLGKTFTALAVIKYFEMRNENVLVLSPKKLENNWRSYQAAAARDNNPLKDDRFSFHLLAHTDLGRESGPAGNIDLSNFNWSNYGLVVIDESHNFRNATKSVRNDQGEVVRTSRYDKLINDVIKEGVNTKVLLLSATPVNTSLMDLRNQIYLMSSGRDDAFGKSLGIHSIGNTVRAAQNKFKEWESTQRELKDKEELLQSLGGEFLHLLGNISIARSRSQIKRFYGDFIKEKGDFPQRKLVTEYPPTDNQGKLSYDSINRLIGELAFHIYRPSKYVIGKEAIEQLEIEKGKYRFNQLTRERFLVDMMRINFLKRLESSAHALTLTLERTIGNIDALLERIERYESKDDLDASIDFLPGDDDEDEDFIVNRKAIRSYHLRELDTQKWRTDILEDRAKLQTVLADIRQITPQRDGKLDMLKGQLKKKAAEKNRKLLVFTAFKDTAEYLWEELQGTAEELGLNVGLVAGNLAKTTQSGTSHFESVLSDFAPQARNRGESGDEIDILIATDCISEGQNLQDCDTVLNYDIHWNPVRLIQRFGRIDRIGSSNKVVRMINYWPTPDMELYLKLESRVRARMALADATATGDENYLDEEDLKALVQPAFDFRDDLAEQMQKAQIWDLEDLSNSVNMSDFTLDYFLTQLLRFLQQNKEELEKTPLGAHAVVSCEEARNLFTETQPGAIFCLRQIESADKHPNNAIYPFYLMQVQKDGVRRGYKSLQQILGLFEATALGKDRPITDLCDAFNREIETEEGKAYYNKMASDAVEYIEQASEKDATESLSSNRSAVLPKVSEKPKASNLELITWLAMKNR